MLIQVILNGLESFQRMGQFWTLFCFLGQMGQCFGLGCDISKPFWTHQWYLLKKIVPISLYGDFKPHNSLKFLIPKGLEIELYL